MSILKPSSLVLHIKKNWHYLQISFNIHISHTVPSFSYNLPFDLWSVPTVWMLLIMYLLYSSICSSVFCIVCKLGTVFRDLIKFRFIWQVALSYFTRRHMISNFCFFLNVNVSQWSMFGSISSLEMTKWWCLILPFSVHLLARKLISRCFPSSILWLPSGAVQDMLDSFSLFTIKIMNWFPILFWR